MTITTKLRDRTLELLLERPVRVKMKTIAFETGIPEGWLKQFQRGALKDPSVNRIETLFEYLSKSELKV